jgi:hypothetical protein
MNIPAELTSAFRNPSTKKAWISDFPAMQGQCENCGGAGVVTAFVATEGPYTSPAHPYLIRDGVRLTSKTDIINGQTKFWVGQTISVVCPECQNTLAPTGMTPNHSWNGAKQLAAKMDFTDR